MTFLLEVVPECTGTMLRSEVVDCLVTTQDLYHGWADQLHRYDCTYDFWFLPPSMLRLKLVGIMDARADCVVQEKAQSVLCKGSGLVIMTNETADLIR